jgi:hypothetical protein
MVAENHHHHHQNPPTQEDPFGDLLVRPQTVITVGSCRVRQWLPKASSGKAVFPNCGMNKL